MSKPDIFACLEACRPGPQPQPVGVIVTPADLDALITAAQEIAPSVDRERLRLNVTAFLAPYVGPWRFLADAQRQPLLETLAALDRGEAVTYDAYLAQREAEQSARKRGGRKAAKAAASDDQQELAA